MFHGNPSLETTMGLRNPVLTGPFNQANRRPIRLLGMSPVSLPAKSKNDGSEIQTWADSQSFNLQDFCSCGPKKWIDGSFEIVVVSPKLPHLS